MYTLYMLRCVDGTFYTGITTDVVRRIREHNSSPLGAKYTRGRRPVTLVFSRRFRNRSLATREEARIKKFSRMKKLMLIHFSEKKSMKSIERGLESIPGVGKRIAQDLREIGIDRPSCLKGKNPERLYEKMCSVQGETVDRCMLYVLRCAVYFVNTKRPDTKKLQWWHWKDTV